MPRILVIGNAIPETVRRGESGVSALRLGGVAAIMAQELHTHGLDVTLLAAASDDIHGKAAQDLLQRQPFTVVTAPASQSVGYAESRIKDGEPHELAADYPTISWAEIGPAATARLALGYDWIAADCNLDSHALRRIARRARPGRLAINGTALDRCRRILSTGDFPKAAVTLNRGEAAVLRQLTHSGADAAMLAGRLNTECLLITEDADGWLLVHDGKVSRHTAAPVPPDTDFIGAGDAATAGLLYALATGREPAPHIDRAISRRLEHNRLPPA